MWLLLCGHTPSVLWQVTTRHNADEFKITVDENTRRLALNNKLIMMLLSGKVYLLLKHKILQFKFLTDHDPWQ